MNRLLMPAVVAVAGGVLLASALFVPYVAVQFRRRGTVGPAPALLALAVLVHALAVVAYTLLPLPASGAGLCVDGGRDPQLQPGRFLADAVRLGLRTPADVVANAAVQQFAFNVALFVPLGAFVRHLTRRGVAGAALTGLAVSGLVELTQLTGVWSLYPCAYRVFDVDDLLANTAGALLGALLAPLLRLLPGQGAQDPEAPRPVTAWRRLLGMASDVVLLTGGGLAAAFTWRALAVGAGLRVPPAADRAVLLLLATLLPAAVLLVHLLSTGRTPGEAVVRLRPRGPLRPARAVLRWLVGAGGFHLLNTSGPGAASSLAAALAVAAAVAVWTTRGHRGLAHALAGWDVEDDRLPLPAAGDEPGRGPSGGR
ncbi:VanZ family protein [Kineococcus sp. SYSU DK018]|uniref:VanZ family protein n=1 Tax=Kineococcus sp. SYSU DK018 TaxID=3383139 RepID=UPI003D7C8966